MSLKRLMLMRQLKILLLDGKEATAGGVAQAIAEDIIDTESPEIRQELPELHNEVTSNCAPRIIDEAMKQLKLDTWGSEDDEFSGAA